MRHTARVSESLRRRHDQAFQNKCAHTWVMYVCILFTIMPRIWMRHTARVSESCRYSHDEPLQKTAHTHESCIFGVFCHNCAKYVNEAYSRCVWVMLHAYMSHVRVRVMSEWDMPQSYMSHFRVSDNAHISESCPHDSCDLTPAAHVNTSGRMDEWVMHHVWMSHTVHINELRCIYKWVMLHIYTNELYCTYKWVVLHMWMCYAVYIY